MARERLLAEETARADRGAGDGPGWAAPASRQSGMRAGLMRRWIALAALVALAIAAAMVADHPGSVDIIWGDWEIATSVGVLAAAVALLAVLLWLLAATVAAVVRLPRRYRRNRAVRVAAAPATRR